VRTVPFGRAGRAVSAVGLGGRWITAKDAAAAARAEVVVRAALDAGLTLIDTAAGYGESETVIGRVLRESGRRALVSTKAWGRDEKKVRESLSRSLSRLNAERIDVYFIHNPEDTLAALPLFRKLKAEGLIGAVGACAWHGEEALARAAIEEGVDALQVAATLFHRGMIDGGVTALAAARGVAVTLMSPFAKGAVTGHPEVAAPLFPYGIRDLATASLKYLLDHAHGAVPIPGTSDPARPAAFARVPELPPVPPEAWEEVFRLARRVPALWELP
jgi:aryl-alcohol dehydrogenase-like predicted oxidoreductase